MVSRALGAFGKELNLISDFFGKVSVFIIGGYIVSRATIGKIPGRDSLIATDSPCMRDNINIHIYTLFVYTLEKIMLSSEKSLGDEVS